MRTLITVILLIAAASALAQPLSGSYTVGGTLADFDSLQQTADALKRRGVSGPTFFNVRPGTYTREGGNRTVLRLDSIVAGLSAVNRITFQPDQSAGGNVGNVILELNRTNACTADRNLVLVKLDFVTLRNMTFRHVDSLNNVCGAVRLILVEGVFTNVLVDDLILDGCRLIGSAYSNSGFTRGTDYGLSGNQTVRKTTITNNRFDRIRWAVFLEIGTTGGDIVVEGNEVYAGYGGGTALTVHAQSVSVKRNYVDFMGGSATAGIQVHSASVAFIEQNIVMNAGGGGFYGIRSLASTIVPDSIIIANTIVSGNIGGSTVGMQSQTQNTRILHNTITNPLNGTGLIVHGENSTVLNNIILNGSAGFLVLDLGTASQALGLISDHNILFFSGNGNLAHREGIFYPTLEEYQSATGLDTNSTFKLIEFVADSFGLHFDACQVQDADLIGIPLPEVRVDFFGAPRDSVRPFIGAVEGTPIPFDMFAAPFKISLPGTPFSIAAGKFDNLLADGLAVPDYDNMQIHLYHNNFSTRTFTHSGTLSTGFRPVAVKFFDLDEDGNLDLIAGGDTTAVKVFWGNGIGGFPADTTLFTRGRVRSLDVGRDNFFNRSTIFMTVDNGFLPNSSFLQYIGNGNGRGLALGTAQRPGLPLTPDTISATLNALVGGDFDGNGDQEIAILATIPFPPSLFVFNDTTANGGGGFLSYGTHYRYLLGTAGYLGFGSSIIMGRFDGDADNDLITTGASTSSVIFMRNQGNFTFSSEQIPVRNAFGVVSLDYENDGNLDFVTVNDRLDNNGLTVFLNDGAGNFRAKENCFFPFASGYPYGVIAADFDLDGKTDIAVASALDSVYVLYNLGGGLTTIHEEQTHETPTQFVLSQNYPNPFNPTTRIEYALPVQSLVTIKIYNILGQEVVTLVDEEQVGGSHTIEWNGRSSRGFPASSGVYFYRLEVRQNGGQFQFTSVKKMLLLK